ncbi:NifU family protein [Paenimyroides tangerinum]|mgnify:CR=1 FL=1|uniref:NifU family protein n=1 Tax=Paenimyroides tangerinum TaxID=2488728 RepID=A0A3P3W8T8_9FLAO|nr:NifU family protein [Paenimyroides tangerinum]RRJ90848.1 NifU family protein [Paenimyroides tangerinum]
MFKVNIKETQNPAILKFEFPDFLSYGSNFEYKNIDETENSPLAKKLFYLPFVKTVYISGNFIAIERFSIVEWADVQDAVAEEIEKFVIDGGKVLIEKDNSQNKKIPVTVYGETTPNPAVLKFVANKKLTQTAIEFKNIDQTEVSPLAKELFKFPYVKEVFIDENYVSISKYDSYDWNDITIEVRSFIKNFIENGGTVIEEDLIVKTEVHEKAQEEYFDKLDVTSQQIINILEEYVKPAVAADGGNISFNSYDDATKLVSVTLQGACSGCPSSTFTLKNGIENMLRQMLNDNDIIVEANNG